MIYPKESEEIDISLIPFKSKLSKLLNECGVDSKVGIADFILAEHISNSIRELIILNDAVAVYKET